MKIMNLLTPILLIAIIALTGCQSTDVQQSAPDQNKNVTEKKEKLPEFWSYEKEITHEGSRSEGSIGRLFYRYNEIPPVFKTIEMGEIVYEFVPMEQLWDDSGYILKEKTGTGGTEYSEQSISSTELKKGWYRTENGKKEGTPGNWIRVETDILDFYAAPDKLSDLAAAYKLKTPDGGPVLLRTGNE